ncbi:MAG: alpha-ketoglutarate-dependent dioxygenase AlkB [Aureispira sp.]
MMQTTGFYQLQLSLEKEHFARLATSVDFENITKGRQGNHLVQLQEQSVPIVRTTTQYTIPAHEFAPIHHQLIQQLNEVIKQSPTIPVLDLAFNNALIEIYTQEYFKMKYHSDQALDLDIGSYIALFSCYEYPETLTKRQLRTLKVKDKTTHEEFSFSLAHNSVILFSLETNTRFSHKIVLEPAPQKSAAIAENRWLGITFRQSKTFIHFEEGAPYFSNGAPLTLAEEQQQKTFYRLRGQENRSQDFVYPSLSYTLSQGDLLSPKLRKL